MVGQWWREIRTLVAAQMVKFASVFSCGCVLCLYSINLSSLGATPEPMSLASLSLSPRQVSPLVYCEVSRAI